MTALAPSDAPCNAPGLAGARGGPSRAQRILACAEPFGPVGATLADLRTAFITLSSSGRLVAMDWPRPGLRLNGQ